MTPRMIPLALSFVAITGGCSRHFATATPVLADSAQAGAATSSAGSDGVVHVPAASLPYIGVEPVAMGDGQATVRAPGRVTFRDGAVASIGTPAAGQVVTMHVQVGDRVAAGDPLVTLASPAAAKARAELARAKVALTAAEDHLRRETEMVARGVGLEVERFDAKTKHDQAAAELERAAEAAHVLGDGNGEVVVVRAPIAGTILQRHATVGASVEVGSEPLVELGDPSALWIVAEVYEGDLASVRVGAEASVRLATATTPVSGRVVSVGAALEEGLRRAPVYIAVDAGAPLLRANTYARVAISAVGTAAVSVPIGAVLIEDGRHAVVYVEQGEGTFARREVSVGSSADADRVQVTAGLSPGERVVVRGTLLLDGSAEQLL